MTLNLYFLEITQKYRVLRNCFLAVNISVLRAVSSCHLLNVNSKTRNSKNILLFTSTRRRKISEIIGVTTFFNCKKHSKNGCFFFQAMSCGFLKWPKMVLYAFLLNARKSPKEEILGSRKSLILGLRNSLRLNLYSHAEILEWHNLFFRDEKVEGKEGYWTSFGRSFGSVFGGVVVTTVQLSDDFSGSNLL